MSDLKDAIRNELKAKFIEINENMNEAIKEQQLVLEKANAYVKVVESAEPSEDKDVLVEDFKKQLVETDKLLKSLKERNQSVEHLLKILDGTNDEALDGVIAICKLTRILND